MTQIEMFPTAQSSPQDTHVNHFHSQGSAEAVKMTDISGRTYFPLFKEKDPLGAFSKMFMGMSLWASMKCFLTWKGKATPQGRLLFQLLPVTHPTEETEFGSSPEMWATPSAADSTGSTGGNQNKSLRTDVKMWPTPTTQDNPQVRGMGKTVGTKRGTTLGGAVRMWPTPTTQDSKNNGGASQHERNTKPLNAEVGGSLNPQWVEWLMGYPEGWTDLED